MKLRKDTTFERAALSQEWREIVAPENGASDGSYRQVSLSIPYGAEIYISLIQDADKVYGVNRTYKGPVARPGAELVFKLRPAQQIYGATKQGVSSVAVAIEYCQE